MVEKQTMALGVRMTVRRKLAGLTLLGVAVAGSVGVIGIHGQSGLYSLYEQSREENFKPMAAMTSLKDAELVAQMALTTAIRGQSSADDAEAQVEDATVQFNEAVGTLESAGMNGGEGPLITKVTADWTALTDAIGKNIEDVRAGKT